MLNYDRFIQPKVFIESTNKISKKAIIWWHAYSAK